MRPYYVFFVLLIVVLVACERPNSPDFTLDQKIQVPMISEKTYQFLGENDALIDTTDPDFESYFSTENDGMVTLSKVEDFNFGTLDDAIPDVTIAQTSVDASVGEIELNDFSSTSGNLGSASFQQVTGQDPGLFPAGTAIPGGTETVEINISTDYLQSATVKGNNGSVSITITNDLGYTIDDMTVSLQSGTNPPLGSDQLASTEDLADNQSKAFEIGFSDGNVLENLKAVIDVSWNSQTMDDNPNELIVSELQGQNLVASQVQAAIASQKFSRDGTVSIDDSNFRFTEADHYIEIEAGELVIDQILNEIDLYIDPLIISFPGIRTAPYNPEDSLTVRFEGASRIPRSSGTGTPPTKNIDLTDTRIYAQNNDLSYNIQGTTENTRDGGGDTRTINETDRMGTTIGINNLSIKEAYGVIVSRNVILNGDDPSNGNDIIDLFNDNEAEIIIIDALSDLSEQLDGIEFTNPELSINYETNIGAPTTIYTSIIGTDASGNRVYLYGDQGGSHYVSSSEIPGILRANGSTLASNQLLKFPIETAQGGNTVTGAVTFDRSQTNVDEFLNNLPSEMRMIILAVVNESMQVGTISDPVNFNPSISVDIPLNFSASSATYSDVFEADLSDLPDPQKDDQRLTDGKLFIEYTNGLPLSIELNLVLQDTAGNEITRIPLPSGDPVVIESGSVDAQTGFVSEVSTGIATLSLNEEQLNVLNKTRKLKLNINLNTDNQEAVRIRGDDTFSVKIGMNAAIESTVN